MFKKGKIVAYPTDTSFGLGVRADDVSGLEELYALKHRPVNKFCSLMVKDWDMLREFAEVPADLPMDFFTKRPRTVILKPKQCLPMSPYWPKEGVGFRVATIPSIADAIDYPVTATSANFSGQVPIYQASKITEQWGSEVTLIREGDILDDSVPPSEIWNYTDAKNPKQIR